MYIQLKNLLEGKKVLILGFGREGRSTYNTIKDINCEIGIADMSDVRFDDGRPVSFYIGNDYQKAIYDYDLVFKSPGIVLEDKSEEVINKITSQTDQMIKRFKDKIVGITGTKGKSTVTTLTYHILKNTIKDVVLMGNIGIPAFDMLDEIDEDSILCYELSCHQLEYAPISPHISVLLNIFEEHLDHYGSFEKYDESKRNVYKNQSEDDILISNFDCIKNIDVKSKNVTTVSMTDKNADVYIDDNCISNFGEKIPFSKIPTNLIGKHNMYNIAVSYNICRIFGVTFSQFSEHIKTYVPLPHRLEYVGEFSGVKYYDDSISTISETTCMGLSSLENVGTLIIGGMDRGICYRPLMDFLKDYKLDNIIFMYKTGEIIYNLAKTEYRGSFENKNLYKADDLKEAVNIAKKCTKKGKICLMSPAAASYGYFKNFEERGNKFKEYVKNID